MTTDAESQDLRNIKDIPADTGGMLIAALTLGFLGYLYYPTLKETALICWDSEDYSHGILLPFIAGYFIHGNWPQIKKLWEEIATHESPLRFSWLGLMLLATGLVIFALGQIANLLFIRWLAFFPSLAGVLFLVCSRKAAWPILSPLLIVFMAKPLPDSLVPKLFFPLQVMAARVSAGVLDLLHVPVYLKGNIIEIPGMQLMVEEACSGLRSLMALLTVAFIVLYSVEMPIYAKCILVVFSIGVAIGLNVVRVASTGILAHFYDPKAASGFFHTFSGMVVFVCGLVILYYFGLILQKLTQPKDEDEERR